MVENFEQVGEMFGLEISPPGEKTTDYFGQLAEMSNLLLAIDNYLLSQLSQVKFRLKHCLIQGVVENQFFIREVTGLPMEAELITTKFLRYGKELILSRLDSASAEDGFDILLQDLTALTNTTEQALAESLTLDGMACVALDRVELIRLLNKSWKFYSGVGKTLKVEILSLHGQPRSFFATDPRYKSWIEVPEEETHTGWLRVHFDNKGMTLKLVGSSMKKAGAMKMADPGFLEKLQSSTANSKNGLLIGDLILAQYRIEEDPLEKTTTCYIIHVVDRFRTDEITHQMDLDL